MVQNKPAKSVQPSAPVAVHQEASSFSGPLPPPQVLEHYNRVIKDGAERIMRLAEEEATHRRKQEIIVVGAAIAGDKSRVTERRLGQIFGLIIDLFTVGCGTYAALNGAQIAGSFIGGTGVTGLVVAFIYGSKQKSNE